MHAACAADPINASCPITASSDTPPIVPSVTGTNYRCVYDDQTNGDPTPSKCYCQCMCMSPAAVDSADQEVQREAAAAGAQDDPDAVGEGAGGAAAGPVAGPMTTVGPFFPTLGFLVSLFSLYWSPGLVASLGALRDSHAVVTLLLRWGRSSGLWEAVERICADGYEQVATNATASATATVSAVVQQLGPHDGFERRRFAH